MVRNSDTSDRYAPVRLAAVGAPRGQAHEVGAVYVRRLKVGRWVLSIRHPGNHAFT